MVSPDKQAAELEEQGIFEGLLLAEGWCRAHILHLGISIHVYDRSEPFVCVQLEADMRAAAAALTFI